ncbi:MAG: VOC family protein [Chlamydiia bacterium]|nr:VOC family protein [Chlamydiia bacterium]
MATPANLQLLYVSDIQRSTEFYKMLFEAEPVFVSPHYIAFSAGPESFFALWSRGPKPNAATPRFSEVGIMLPSNEDVDQLFEKWKADDRVTVIEAPMTDVFGRTFVIGDPDGHMIRVCLRD